MTMATVRHASSGCCAWDRIIRAVYHRLFDFTMSIILLGIAIHLSLWPRSVAASSFRYILDYVPEMLMAWFFLLLAAARLCALVVNGASMRIGPHVRGFGAIAGAVIWAQMAAALYISSVAGDFPPSPGIPVYVALTLAELLATYKAASDVRASR